MNERKQANKKAYKDALNEYRNHLGSYLSLSMLYLTIVTLLLVLAYFFPFTLILSVPLILVPFTFALQASVSLVSCNQTENKSPFAIFFKSFAVYYSAPFFGGYRGIVGLLKALAAFAIGMSLILFPISIYVLTNNPVIKDIITSNSEVTTTYLYEILMNDNLFAYGLMYSLGVGTLFASLIYIHHFMAHSLVVVSTLHTVKPIPMNVHKSLYKYIFPGFRRTYYREYCSGIWWLLILYLIGFAIGFALIFFIKDRAFEYNAHIIALAGAFLFVTPFSPYVFLLLDKLLVNNIVDYNNANMEATLTIMAKVKVKGQLSKEEEDEIQKSFDELNDLTKINPDEKDEDK